VSYWAPDWTQLIVRTEAEKGKRLAGYIYRVDADGSDLVNLSKQSGSPHDAMPAWSPDGNEIVYRATKPDDAVPSLYVMGRNGPIPDRWLTSISRLSTPRVPRRTHRLCRSPEWGVRHLLDCTRRHQLARLTDDPGDDNWPTYSPDGTKIAFFPNRDGTDGIWVMNADGSDPRRIAEGGEPNWSPQGDWITFECGTAEQAVVCAARPEWVRGTRTLRPSFVSGDPAVGRSGRRVVAVVANRETKQCRVILSLLAG
jgi:TolB protein